MRHSLIRTSMVITLIYSVLFAVPFSMVPARAGAEDQEKSVTPLPSPENCAAGYLADQLSSSDPLSRLRISNCISDSITAVGKIQKAIRLLNDTNIMDKGFEISRPNTRWEEAYYLIREVERMYQDDHLRRIPEDTLRLIRATGNLVKYHYRSPSTSVLSKIMNQNQKSFHRPGVIPQAMLYWALIQLRYRLNESGDTDIKNLVQIVKSYLAPGIDPDKVKLHFPEAKESYDAINYRLKSALIFQFQTHRSTLRAAEGQGGGLFFGTADESGGDDRIKKALKEIDATLDERIARQIRDIAVWVLGTMNDKDHEGIIKYCAEFPHKCDKSIKPPPADPAATPVAPTPPTVVDTKEERRAKLRAGVDKVVSETAEAAKERFAEKIEARADSLQELREAKWDLREANQYVDYSLLVQAIVDPMSAYTDPMLAQFMDSFAVEIPALNLKFKSQEEANQWAETFKQLVKDGKVDLKSAAETDALSSMLGKGSKLGDLGGLGGSSDETEAQEGNVKARLGAILASKGRMKPLTRDLAYTLNKDPKSTHWTVGLVVFLDRKMSNPFFKIEGFRLALGTLTYFTKVTDRIMKAAATPNAAKGWRWFWNSVLRFVYIVNPLGAFGGGAGGVIHNGTHVESKAAGVIKLFNASGKVIDTLPSENTTGKIVLDKIREWSKNGRFTGTIMGRPINISFHSLMMGMYLVQIVKHVNYVARSYTTSDSNTQFRSAFAKAAAELIHTRLYFSGTILWGSVLHNLTKLFTAPVKWWRGQPIAWKESFVPSTNPWVQVLSGSVFFMDVSSLIYSYIREPERKREWCGFEDWEPCFDYIFSQNTGEHLFNFIGHFLINMGQMAWTRAADLGATDRFEAQVIRSERLAGLSHSRNLSKCASGDIVSEANYLSPSLAKYKIATPCIMLDNLSAAMNEAAVRLKNPAASPSEKIVATEKARVALDLFEQDISSMALAMLRSHYMVSLMNNNGEQPALADRLHDYVNLQMALKNTFDDYRFGNPAKKIRDEKTGMYKKDVNGKLITRKVEPNANYVVVAKHLDTLKSDILAPPTDGDKEDSKPDNDGQIDLKGKVILKSLEKLEKELAKE